MLTALAAMLLTLATAPAAVAHTKLLDTDPTDGQILPDTPAAITLSFNEPIGASAETIQLLAPTGDTVALSVQAIDDTVEITPPSTLEDGTYVLAWRVISADTHPISGSFTFSVGAPSATVAEVDQHSAPPVVHAYHGSKMATYLGIFAASGLVLFDLAFLDARPGTVPGTRRRLHRLARISAAAAITGAVVSVPATTMWQDAADLSAITDSAMWASAAGSATALAAVMTVTGVLTAVIAAPRATRPHGAAVARGAALARRTALVGAAVAAASLLVTGHTRSFGPGWLVLTTDAVHIVAGLTWFGGILGLITVLSRTTDTPARAATATLVRFSTAAAWVVLALTITGLTLGWRILGSLEALVTTGYGQVLLIKIAVVLGVVAIAAWNRFTLLPRITASTDTQATTALHSAVQNEAALLALILAITALLTSLNP